MCQPRKWWPGLIPLVLLWLMANWSNTDRVETDLSQRSASIAKGAGIADSAIKVAGRDISIQGRAFNATDAGKVAGAIDALSGVRLVKTDEVVGLAVAKPYVWTTARDGNVLTLTGSVPSPEAREKLIAAAKLAVPGAQIVDNLTYASGAPANFEAASAYGLAALAGLSKGAASLTDSALSLSGLANGSASYAALMDALKKLPSGLSLAKADVTLPGPSAADLDAKAKADAAAKLAADTKAKAEADAKAKQAADAKVALDAKAAADAKAKAEADAKLAADAKAKAEADAKVKAASAATCQVTVKTALNTGKILFRTAGANLTSESEVVLKALVAAFKSCPQNEVEVAGHTDNVGDPERNLDLSKRRAEAVVSYFLKSGLPAASLSAIGYGESRPVASNDTAEGKSLNRRIEFTVK